MLLLIVSSNTLNISTYHANTTDVLYPSNSVAIHIAITEMYLPQKTKGTQK